MSNNNDNGGAVFGIALVFAVLWLLMIAAYAIACFVAAIFTVLSILAWHRTIRLGSLVIHPHEARQFVLCGIIGAVGLPVFTVFCLWLFESSIEDKWWFYIITGGYAFGSIGLSMMLEENDAHIIAPFEEGPVLPSPPPKPQLPPAPLPPFAYASWDDEAAEADGERPECEGCAFNGTIPTETSFYPEFPR